MRRGLARRETRRKRAARDVDGAGHGAAAAERAAGDVDRARVRADDRELAAVHRALAGPGVRAGEEQGAVAVLGQAADIDARVAGGLAAVAGRVVELVLVARGRPARRWSSPCRPSSAPTRWPRRRPRPGAPGSRRRRCPFDHTSEKPLVSMVDRTEQLARPAHRVTQVDACPSRCARPGTWTICPRVGFWVPPSGRRGRDRGVLAPGREHRVQRLLVGHVREPLQDQREHGGRVRAGHRRARRRSRSVGPACR